MTPIFATTRRVEFAHTDLAGIMHFSRFLVMMEEAEHEFLRSRGLSVVMPHGNGKLGFPRVAVTCDYLRPAYFEDVLEIGVSIEKLGTKSITYGFLFSQAGNAIARGTLTCCCCTVEPGQKLVAIPIPDHLRHHWPTPSTPPTA